MIGAAVSNGGSGDVGGGGLPNGKAVTEDKKDNDSGSPSRKAPPPPKPSLVTKEPVSWV